MIGLVFLITVIVSATALVMNVAFPMMENMKDTSSIKDTINTMNSVDKKIREVSSEEKLSSREFNLIFNRGHYYCENETNSLIYQLETETDFISPHTSRKLGNVKITADANVKANKTQVNETSCYMLENEYLKICIKSIGSENNQTLIDTSELLVYYYNKEVGRELDINLSVFPNENKSLGEGTGYTYLREEGNYIGKGRVTAYVRKNNISYKVIFQLYSGSDFLMIDPRSV